MTVQWPGGHASVSKLQGQRPSALRHLGSDAASDLHAEVLSRDACAFRY